MTLAYKQLIKQVLRNRIFVILLALLTVLTSLSFFFVRFSIDGNIGRIAEIAALGSDIVRYRTAQSSNAILAYTFFAAMNVLTSFVFFIFFYRFFRSGRKQMGSLKALGFRDTALRGFFVSFTAALSLLGGLVGLCAAYPMSQVLIRANMQTYSVTGLVRALNVDSILVGILGQTAAFTLTAFLCYSFIKGKEPGALIAGNLAAAQNSPAFRAATAITDILPIKNKFPLRIALRKPLAVLLILIAVMSLSVFVILGRSLNISSRLVFDSQTRGHNYEYDILYSNYILYPNDTIYPNNIVYPNDTIYSNNIVYPNDIAGGEAEDSLRYLSATGKIAFNDNELNHSILALYGQNALFGLQDARGNPVALPTPGGAVISPGLSETYGLRVGETLAVALEGGGSMALTVESVAFNAKSGSIYVNPADFANSLGIAPGSYNGQYSDNAPGSHNAQYSDNAPGSHNAQSSDEAPIPAKAQITTRENRIDALKRDAVSNQISGVINQATGVLVGCILFFLALYVNFQDNTHDMLVLHMMGYRIKAIRKMLIDVYRPLVWLCFVITLYPSIMTVKSIQRSLSVSTGDYMPFGTNCRIIFVAFVALTLLYQFAQWAFGAGIGRVVGGEGISECVGGE